jgi:hypothetical protein
VAHLLDSEELDVVGPALPLYPPDAFVCDAKAEPCARISNGVELQRGERGLTIKEEARKFDADITVPLCHSAALNFIWDVHSLELLDLAEDAVLCSEADDDLGHAEEEGLDPVFHELSVKPKLVVLVADFGARFELDPVDGCSRCLRLRVPDCTGVSMVVLGICKG